MVIKYAELQKIFAWEKFLTVQIWLDGGKSSRRWEVLFPFAKNVEVNFIGIIFFRPKMSGKNIN